VTDADPDILSTVQRFYATLGKADADGVRDLIAPDFEAHFAKGLPLGVGGHHKGAEATITDGWWAMGKVYRMTAVPEEWIPTNDGRLVVLGAYRGHARATGKEVDASFVHVWTLSDGRLTSLVQITDTSLWTAALEPDQPQKV
jgi:ketosteroid isomerase-like protein